MYALKMGLSAGSASAFSENLRDQRRNFKMYLKQYEEVKIMRITDLLSKESIRLDGVSAQKEPFVQMADLWRKRAEKYQIRMLYVEGLIKRGRKYDGSRRGGIAILIIKAAR